MTATASTAVGPAKAPHPLRAAISDWNLHEVPRWVFVGKTVAAALLSLWISFRLGFTAPSTSLITVFIVAQPQSGLVLAKSFYRMIGTLIGALVAIVMVASVVQERELLVAGLALWVGLCTAGAAYFRGFQSYAFVLSGYTAMLIGIPSVAQPEQVFDTALFRISEIMVGILSTGIITDAILPKRVATVLVASVRRVYADFAGFVDMTFHGNPGTRRIEDRHLAMIQDIVAFETQRSAAGFEDPEMRIRDSRLRLFNADLVQAQTALNAFTRALARGRRRGRDTSRHFTSFTRECVDALRVEGRFPAMAVQAVAPLQRLRAFREGLDAGLALERSELVGSASSIDAGVIADFDIAASLFRELVDELVRFTAAYTALATARNPVKLRAPTFALHTDALTASLMAVRAGITVVVLSSFWILSAWPAGGGATLIGGVVAALFGAAPNPGAAVRRFVEGFVIGLIAAAFCSIVLLPRVSGFPMFCLVLAPFLMASAYLMTDLKTAAIGLAVMLMFGNSLAIRNQMVYDPAQLLNDGIAQLIGVLVAGVAFSVLVPARSGWFDRRLRSSLRRYAAELCVVPLKGVRHRFESRLRDALTQIAAFGSGKKEDLDALIAHQLAVLDIAHAVFRLRDVALQLRGPFPSQRVRRPLLLGIRDCLLRPDDLRRDRALTEVGNFIALLEEPREVGADRERVRALRLCALRIESILLDDGWFADLAAPVRAAPLPDPPVAEPELPPHAA